MTQPPSIMVSPHTHPRACYEWKWWRGGIDFLQHTSNGAFLVKGQSSEGRARRKLKGRRTWEETWAIRGRESRESGLKVWVPWNEGYGCVLADVCVCIYIFAHWPKCPLMKDYFLGRRVKREIPRPGYIFSSQHITQIPPPISTQDTFLFLNSFIFSTLQGHHILFHFGPYMGSTNI